MLEPEKKARAPEDVAPRGGGFAGMVAIQDAAPVIKRWLQAAVALLALSVLSNVAVVWCLVDVRREMASLVVAANEFVQVYKLRGK